MGKSKANIEVFLRAFDQIKEQSLIVPEAAEYKSKVSTDKIEQRVRPVN